MTRMLTVNIAKFKWIALLWTSIILIMTPISHFGITRHTNYGSEFIKIPSRLRWNHPMSMTSENAIDKTSETNAFDRSNDLYVSLRDQLRTVSEQLQLERDIIRNAHSPSMSSNISKGYLTSTYYAVKDAGGGVGNNMFELVSILGIASSLGRVPFIDSNETAIVNGLEKLRGIFPELVRQFEIRSVQDSPKVLELPVYCCVFYNLSDVRLMNGIKNVKVDGRYLQSFKYFDNIADQVRSSILRISDNITSIAREQVIEDRSAISDGKQMLCVHVRRGDFIKSEFHMESRENFTVWAINHILQKDGHGNNASVLLFGNDRDWSGNVSQRYFGGSLHVTNSLLNVTPVVDVAFAQHYCDTILLTASASTFGWWAAYLSHRASKVYYNTEFSKPQFVEKLLEPSDFFPANWIPLTMPPDYHLPHMLNR